MKFGHNSGAAGGGGDFKGGIWQETKERKPLCPPYYPGREHEQKVGGESCPTPVEPLTKRQGGGGWHRNCHKSLTT